MTEHRLPCPSCQTVLQVHDEFRGKTVRCPACQNRLRVPGARPLGLPVETTRWYLARNRQKLGPYSPAQLRQMVAVGGLRSEDMLLREGEAKWVVASGVRELFPEAASTPVRKAPPPLPQASRPAPPQPQRRAWLYMAGGLAATFALAASITFFLVSRATPTRPDQTADAGQPSKTDQGTKQPDKPVPEKKFDASFVAAGFNAAVVVHPKRLLQSPALAPLPQEKLFSNVVALGLDPRQLEEAVLLFDLSLGSPETISGGAILRFSRPIDAAKVVKTLFPAASSTSDQGKSYLKMDVPFAASALCVHQADQRTVVTALEPELRKMLSARDARSPLIDRLNRTDLDGDLVAVCTIEPVRKADAMVRELLKVLPPQFADATRLPDYLQSATVTLNLTGADLLTLDLDTVDAAAAGKVLTLAQTGLSMVKDVYPAARREILADAPSGLAGPLVELADELMEGIEASREGPRVTIKVDMPQGLPKVVEKGVPLVELLFAAQSPGSTRAGSG